MAGMKVLFWVVSGALTVFACAAQNIYPNPPAPSAPLAVAFTNTANYSLEVQWKTAKGETNTLKVVTADGQFSLDTLQTNRVKINNHEIPITVRCSGALTVLSPEKGRLNLFLGRTVPYATAVNVGGNASTSTVQQMQAGLNANYMVTFGKAMVIQSDGHEEITLVVNRLPD